jgi:uncharacterized protein (DUF1778 family)
MKKKLFNELKESLNQAVEHAKGESVDLRTTVCFDNAHFVLNDEQWREFNKKLEMPPRDLLKLRQLLNDRTVLE